MHFCPQELMLILAVVPFVRPMYYKLHDWYLAKFKKDCHITSCKEHNE